MDNDKKIQIDVNKIIQLIYEMYLKDLKEGYIKKDKLIPCYGKICKKRGVLKKYEDPKLFKY